MPEIIESSFRDPSGFVFKKDNKIYRQINKAYKDTFEAIENSELFPKLFARQLLVPHKTVDIPGITSEAYRVIEPLALPFISYPYEWSFSQLKEAALLTLEIQELSIDSGFSLKDASAYNVQLYEGKSIFIDTLSFEKLPEDKPWVAYKQFCQHFLIPLALMAKTDISLQQLLKSNIDGIPLKLATKLLPLRTKFDFSLLVHIHLHAAFQSKHADKVVAGDRKFSLNSFKALLDSLKTAIKKLKWRPDNTEWGTYYDANNNYDPDSMSMKEAIVGDFVAQCSPFSVWDLGANTGKFSRVSANYCDHVCAWDIDPACVERNFLMLAENKQRNIYPLLLDLFNPSPAIGWANNERPSFQQRGGVDLVLALGLIHHLTIGNNLSFDKTASFFASISSSLIIEFIPKTDSQVVKLLRNRGDIFAGYDQETFEDHFSSHFKILKSEKLGSSGRIVYLMSK